MAKRKLGKNTLPLLAITALVLSVALVNYDKSLVSNSNSTQSVLSESDENKEDEKKEEKVEEKKEVKNEERKQEEKRSTETVRIENKGTRVKIEVKNRVSNRNEIKIEDDDIDEVEIDDESETEDEIDDEQEEEFEEESEITSPDGSVNRFKLKIKTRTTAGKTIIETGSGEVEVENDPEETVNELVEKGFIDNPTSVEIKENEREKVEFEIQGTDSKKFLGIFKVVIPKTITVSSETGEVVSTNQNVWSRIISLLSI